MLRLLTLSSLYPNAAQPEHGVFVEERLRHLLATGEVAAEVVAPVPWFPFSSSRFGKYGVFARVPRDEVRNGVRVSHPRVPLIPKFGMSVSPWLMAAAVRGAVRAVRHRAPFDAIDAHYLYPDGVAAALLAMRLGKPFVLTARGSDVNVIARHAVPRRWILWAAARAGRVVAVSGALRAELVRLGVDEGAIEVLPNGVDLERFNSEGPRAQGADGLRRLLVVAHLKPGKGHRTVIEALKDLPNCVLEIAGDGPLRRQLEELARVLQVADRVRFLGSVSHAELAQVYRAADALLLVSDREGMPNVVLESLACGTPVVATRVGGIPEVLTDPIAGVLLDSSATAAVVAGVRRLLASPRDPRRVREFALRFGWQRATEGQLAIFRGLAGKNVTAGGSHGGTAG